MSRCATRRIAPLVAVLIADCYTYVTITPYCGITKAFRKQYSACAHRPSAYDAAGRCAPAIAQAAASRTGIALRLPHRWRWEYRRPAAADFLPGLPRAHPA